MFVKFTYKNNGKSNGREFFLNVNANDIERISDLGDATRFSLFSGEAYTVAESLEECNKKLGLELIY